jgi:hypothetical protein
MTCGIGCFQFHKICHKIDSLFRNRKRLREGQMDQRIAQFEIIWANIKNGRQIKAPLKPALRKTNVSKEYRVRWVDIPNVV